MRNYKLLVIIRLPKISYLRVEKARLPIKLVNIWKIFFNTRCMNEERLF